MNQADYDKKWTEYLAQTAIPMVLAQRRSNVRHVVIGPLRPMHRAVLSTSPQYANASR